MNYTHSPFCIARFTRMLIEPLQKEIPMFEKISYWMFQHSTLYVKFDRKFLEGRRHKRLLANSAALREANRKLMASRPYISDVPTID